MGDTQRRNRRYELITWGALFLWAGVRDLIPGLPVGTGLVGVGLILLGLNTVRRLRDIPINVVSTTLGVMVLLLGLVVLFLSLQGIRVVLPFFPVLLAVIGVILLVHSAAGIRGAARTENG
jgi:hypothetical protein